MTMFLTKRCVFQIRILGPQYIYADANIKKNVK